MDEPAPRPAAPSWLPWMGGAALVTLAGLAFLLWGLRGGAMLLDLVAAYCF